MRQNATYDEERSWNQMLGYGAHPLKQELRFFLLCFSLGKQAPQCSRFGTAWLRKSQELFDRV